MKINQFAVQIIHTQVHAVLINLLILFSHTKCKNISGV